MVNGANASPDAKEIADLVTAWSKAVREEDRAGIRAAHAPDILMFDVPPPFQSKGIEAYMATWEIFFGAAEKPVKFDLTELAITTGAEVAFATAIGRCVNIDPSGRREPLDFRLTIGLRKVGGRWWIAHEHHSLPAV